jgi:hypothetical protein
MYLYIRVNVEGNRTIKFLIILHLNSLIPTINQDKWQYNTFNLIGISIKKCDIDKYIKKSDIDINDSIVGTIYCVYVLY